MSFVSWIHKHIYTCTKMSNVSRTYKPILVKRCLMSLKSTSLPMQRCLMECTKVYHIEMSNVSTSLHLYNDVKCLLNLQACTKTKMPNVSWIYKPVHIQSCLILNIQAYTSTTMPSVSCIYKPASAQRCLMSLNSTSLQYKYTNMSNVSTSNMHITKMSIVSWITSSH